MKTHYKGIDYGLGKTNIDENKIRYGIIHQNEVGEAWFNESETRYYYICPYCEFEIGLEYFDSCPHCDKEVLRWEQTVIDPDNFLLTEVKELPIISNSGRTYWGKPPHWHYCDGYLAEYNKKHGFEIPKQP